ncbi:sensor histidine kinase [Streptomyces vietnamensis]|uniref:Putative two-component sensory kinase n=1 Tax=Streptomyces vietnamensis TaxID=362257 RepID=E3T489_9ACTN|nr:histidine kinase [Streptomyces vietnamensis]ADO32765.1 putative two-component sensory kinase [Streptomyces vietnamensis]
MNSTERQSDDPNGAAPHLPHDGSTVPAPRLARSVLLATMAGYSLVTAVNILDAGASPRESGAGFLALLVIFGLQLVHSRPNARQSSYTCRVTTLTLQAVFCFLPLALFHLAWGAMCGFLAGSVLLLLPARAAWPLYVAIGLSLYGYAAFIADRGLFDSVYTLETTLVTGLVVFGLSSLTGLVTRLHAQRSDLARLAVAEERLRFSRDLHDLLGYNLSAITLKTELVRRLVPDMPAPARVETDSVLALSRQSLADVRKVATGYRDMSLREEAAATRSMLEAAGIKVVTAIDTAPLPPQIDTVLATVLREAVTNALRHSHVHRCTIRCGEEDGVVTLSIDNDGVEPADRHPGGVGPLPRQGADEPGGTGLGNLTHRLGRLGGSLTTELGDDGWFRMTARAPLSARPDKVTLNRKETAQK